jgi:hypothetical protein
MFFQCLMGIGDWGLGIGPNPQSPIPNPHGDWGLGIGDWANPQSPIPNPQSPKANSLFYLYIYSILF